MRAQADDEPPRGERFLPRLGPKLGRRKTALLVVLVVLALLVLILAWYQGGERPLRPIEEEISVPEGVL